MQPFIEIFPDAPFRAVYAPEFSNRLQDRKYRKHQEAVHQVVQRICLDPFRRSHLLTNKHGHDWRGKRDRHVKGNLVLVFAICAECKRQGFHQEGWNTCCDDPSMKPDDLIVFLTLGSHKALFGRD